jgi:hypothetical protein
VTEIVNAPQSWNGDFIFPPTIQATRVSQGGSNVLRPMIKRNATGYVDRILKGARPAYLPVRLAPNSSSYQLNRRARLSIRPIFLARADEVIE